MNRSGKWLLRIALGLTALAFLAYFATYFAFRYKEHEARRVIQQFHQQMNKGDFTQILDDAAGHIRLGSSRDEWLASMGKIRDSLGNFEGVRSSTIRCEAGPVFLCRASYVSTFEKGEATELFKLNGASGRLRLFEYSILIGGHQFPPRRDSKEPNAPSTS